MPNQVKAAILLLAPLLALLGLACATPEPDPRIASNARTITDLQQKIEKMETERNEQVAELKALRERVDQAENMATMAGESAIADMMMPHDLDMMGQIDLKSIKRRIAELDDREPRFTRETATPDQAAIVIATSECLTETASGSIPPELATKLAWAEAGVTEDDRDLIENSIEQCAAPYIMTAMMSAMTNMTDPGAPPPTEQELIDRLPTDLTTENPTVIELAQCAPDTETEANARKMAAIYLSILPEPARDAAVRLYCAN